MTNRETATAAKPCWFGSNERPLFGCLHTPSRQTRTAGVVLCAPFGHEYMVSYQAYRRLAESLAQAGFPVLRFDYDGTGDSAGQASDDGRVAAWQKSIGRAIAELRQRTGVKDVTLIGVRLGALLAASVAAEHGVAALVLVAPVANGRVYTRELLALRAMNAAANSANVAEEEVAGYPLTASTRADLALLDIAKMPGPLAPAALIFARDDMSGNEERIAAALNSGGTDASLIRVGGYSAMMPDDAYNARAPDAMWGETVQWLAARFAVRTDASIPESTDPERVTATLVESGGAVREEIVTIRGMVGIVTEPAMPGQASGRPAIILTNIGANHRVGTHRLYVTIARSLAAHGFTVVRFDRAGIGDSPATPRSRANDVYAEGGVDDVRAAIDAVVARRGVTNCALVGLCSGAYFSYHAAVADPRVAGLVLINPLAFHWREGDSLAVRTRETYKSTTFYLRTARDLHAWKRLFQGDINVLGIGRTLATRLTERAAFTWRRVIAHIRRSEQALTDIGQGFLALDRRGTECMLVFGAEDGGIDLMIHHLGHDASLLRGRPRFRLEIVDGADHTFTPLWSQVRLSDLISRHFATRFVAKETP